MINIVSCKVVGEKLWVRGRDSGHFHAFPLLDLPSRVMLVTIPTSHCARRNKNYVTVVSQNLVLDEMAGLSCVTEILRGGGGINLSKHQLEDALAKAWCVEMGCCCCLSRFYPLA